MINNKSNQPGVYFLHLKNDRYYIGSTNNIQKRVNEHKDGRVKATRYLRPLRLVLFYPMNTIKEARQLEYKLKKLKSRKIVEKIIKSKKITTE